MSYRNFDLALFVQGVGKRDMFPRGELVEPFHFNYSQVMYQHQLDYWTPVNPNAKFPGWLQRAAESTPTTSAGSDLYLFNAAYARLKNVQIGYSIPLQPVAAAQDYGKPGSILPGRTCSPFPDWILLTPNCLSSIIA